MFTLFNFVALPFKDASGGKIFTIGQFTMYDFALTPSFSSFVQGSIRGASGRLEGSWRSATRKAVLCNH